MATGRKKKKSVTFSVARFFGRAGSAAPTEGTKATVSSSDRLSHPDVTLPMTSLELQSTRGETSALMTSSLSVIDNESWFSAVQNNDLKAVNSLLSDGADVNAISKTDGWSALHIASWNGWIDLVQLLIASGSELDIVGPGNVTPLALASQRGHTLVVRSLVYAGCDVKRRAELRLAAPPPTTTIAGGVDFRCSHVTAAHLAARYGNVGALRCLVSAGADVDAAMTIADRVGGITPLHLAVEAGHIDAIDYLISAGSDVNTSTERPDCGEETDASCATPPCTTSRPSASGDRPP